MVRSVCWEMNTLNVGTRHCNEKTLCDSMGEDFPKLLGNTLKLLALEHFPWERHPRALAFMRQRQPLRPRDRRERRLLRVRAR